MAITKRSEHSLMAKYLPPWIRHGVDEAGRDATAIAPGSSAIPNGTTLGFDVVGDPVDAFSL